MYNWNFVPFSSYLPRPLAVTILRSPSVRLTVLGSQVACCRLHTGAPCSPTRTRGCRASAHLLTYAVSPLTKYLSYLDVAPKPQEGDRGGHFTDEQGDAPWLWGERARKLSLTPSPAARVQHGGKEGKTLVLSSKQQRTAGDLVERQILGGANWKSELPTGAVLEVWHCPASGSVEVSGETGHVHGGKLAHQF